MRASWRQSSEPIEPPAPGDEHGLVLDVRGDRVDVDLDRLAAEQVLDLDRADLLGEVEIAGDQLVQPRQRLHRHVLRAGHLGNAGALLAGGGRNRDQELVGSPVAEDVRQLVARAEHADPVQAQVLLARVVVDQADRRVAEVGRAQDLLQHQLGGVARTDDDHLLAARHDRAALRALDDRPRQHPRSRHERQRQQPVDHPDGAWHLGGVDVEEAEHEEQDEARCDDSARGAPHVPRRDVAPPAVVEAGEREDAELDHRDEREDRPGDVVLVVDGQVGVEAEPEGEEPGDDDDREVRRQLRQPVPVDRRSHARADATPTASRTVETTRSCTSASIPPHSGSARFSAAALSVSGSEPGSQPRYRSAGWRWSGVT